MSGNYMKPILEAWRRGVIPPGSLSAVQVAHDDWCAIHKGNDCNCNPQLLIERDGEVFEISEDGTLRPAKA